MSLHENLYTEVLEENSPRPAQSPKLKLLDQKSNSEKKSHYRIANADQLAVVGKGFLEEFRTGKKSFAFSSTNYKASQQRTVLGLASYFDHLFDLKILIISDSLYLGVFKELVEKSFPIDLPQGPGKRFHHHFDFLELKLLHQSNDSHKEAELLGLYDLVLWDLPVLSTKKAANEALTLSAANFESLSLIVSPSASKFSDRKGLEKHFKDFGIDVSGILFKEGSGF